MEETKKTKEIEWPERIKNLVYDGNEWRELVDLLSKFLPGPLIEIITGYKFPWCVDCLFADDILRNFKLSVDSRLFKWYDQSLYKDCRSLHRLYRKIKGIGNSNIPVSGTYFHELVEYMMKPFYSPNINKITISMNGSSIIRLDICPEYGTYCFGDLIKDFLQLIDDVINDTRYLFIDTLVSECAYIRSCDISNGKSDNSLLVSFNLDRGY